MFKFAIRRFLALFKRTYVATKCGHKTRQSGMQEAFGERCWTKMPLMEDGTVEYCLGCINKMAIQCVVCGGPIFIGDGLSLCPHFPNIPETALELVHGAKYFPICMKVGCVDSQADRSGTWMPPGVVSSEGTVMARSLGGAVYIGDSEGDPRGSVIRI